MGNTSSSSRTGESKVDEGFLTPHGIYTGLHDWNAHTVGHFIVERRLAPFYRPLEEYDANWDEETVLAARRGPEPEHDAEPSTSSSKHAKASSKAPKESQKPSEAAIYKNAVECPICFMFYPPNINHSRCCFQAICTECFVQIKRIEPTPTHLVSEPACCPFCQQENFGVTYTPPPWRTGLTSDPNHPSRPDLNKAPSDTSRRKSLSHDSPDVVTTDQIRPDWEERLAAVKAAVARRANRRIIMRQVGDRLIPVGVTSSRTVLPEGITTVEDIEELMLMEAMRLSLIEQERANNPGGSNSTRTPTPNRVANDPSSSNSSPLLASADDSRRVGLGPFASITSPLANSSNMIAVSTGLPSSPEPQTRNAMPHTTQPESHHGSLISTLRGRFSSSASSHRRVDSNPPPTTALTAAMNANLTAGAFLRPPASHSQEDSPSGSTSLPTSRRASTENQGGDQSGSGSSSVGQGHEENNLPPSTSSSPPKTTSTVIDVVSESTGATSPTTTAH